MDRKLDEKITKYLEDNRDNFIKDLQKLLSFNSVNAKAVDNKPFGEEVAKALDFMMELCADAGLKTTNYDYYCMDACYGDGEESIGTLSHLDIVPAGEGWDYPPFAGEMEGSLIYGRGVIDDKGPAIAALYAIKSLIDADVKMSKTIKLILGCDEETGMSDMEHYMKVAGAPTYAFSPDADFPVIFAEKNIIHGDFEGKIEGDTILVSLSGGTATNAVPNKATAQIKYSAQPENNDKVEYKLEGDILTITAKGIAGHASLPEKAENAISILMKELAGILPDGDAAKPFIAELAAGLSATDGSGIGIDCKDEATGALTLNHGVIKMKDNKIISQFDIRHPVTLDYKELLEKLKTALNNFKLTHIFASEGLYAPKDGFLVSTLQSLYREITGDASSEPVSMGGGTYARCLPAAVAFGPKFPGGKAGGAHTINEFADVDELLKAARLYAHCLYSLAK
ncbi:MAG: Sapep family Mn(2+)-dependent dipeptidase [Eubacteriales bacterium]